MMKVILSVPDEGYSRTASCAISLISMFLFIFIYTYNTYNGHFLFYRFGKNNEPPNVDLRSFLLKQASLPEKRNRDRTSGFYSNW